MLKKDVLQKWGTAALGQCVSRIFSGCPYEFAADRATIPM
jgi:hypothetical protein